MMLTVDKVCEALLQDSQASLSIVPCPDIKELQSKGGASIDLRLGRWFSTIRQASSPYIDVDDEQPIAISNKSYFIPFDGRFFLHPGRFVLGITLEWMKLPAKTAAYVTGKSSWGRRGLIIETAAGIHPGFSGCLALELANVGELPIVLRPGRPICQIFFHQTTEGPVAASAFDGRRRPVLGVIQKDSVLKRLTPKPSTDGPKS